MIPIYRRAGRVYSYMFRKKKKIKKCPSEIMRMNKEVTFMALRIVERHPAQDRLLISFTDLKKI